MSYSFCESASQARPYKYWHIRKVEGERYPGGGADTDALCGVDVDWDLGPTVDSDTVHDGTCEECVKAWEEEMSGAEIYRLSGGSEPIMTVEAELRDRPLPFEVEVPGRIVALETDRDRRIFIDGLLAGEDQTENRLYDGEADDYTG